MIIQNNKAMGDGKKKKKSQNCPIPGPAFFSLHHISSLLLGDRGPLLKTD